MIIFFRRQYHKLYHIQILLAFCIVQTSICHHYIVNYYGISHDICLCFCCCWYSCFAHFVHFLYLCMCVFDYIINSYWIRDLDSCDIYIRMDSLITAEQKRIILLELWNTIHIIKIYQFRLYIIIPTSQGPSNIDFDWPMAVLPAKLKPGLKILVNFHGFQQENFFKIQALGVLRMELVWGNLSRISNRPQRVCRNDK